MKNFNKILKLPEFQKDIKKLAKKFKTIESDLDILIKTQFELYHKHKIDNGGIVRISNLGTKDIEIFKARKFACRSLKGRGVQSGIRVIYSYCAVNDKIELIEIYFKGSKVNEDMNRIKKYIEKQ